MQEARELTKEDRVRIFFEDLCRLDELVEAVHRKALEGDNAAVHAEVKVLERRARMIGLDAPRQLDMTLEVHARPTRDALRSALERMAAQGKLSAESQQRIRPFGYLPEPRAVDEPSDAKSDEPIEAINNPSLSASDH